MSTTTTNDPFYSSTSFPLLDFTIDDGHDQLSNKDIQIDATSMNAEVEAVNLDMFLKDVESIKHELKELKKLYKRIEESHEESNTNNSKVIKRLVASQMDSDVALSLYISKSIIFGLELLHRSNTDNLKLPGCGQGSSSDRTRTFIVEGLREKLKHTMKKFSSLRERIGHMHKEEGEQLIINEDIESQLVGKVNSFVKGGENDEQQRKSRMIMYLKFAAVLSMPLIFTFMFLFAWYIFVGYT